MTLKNIKKIPIEIAYLLASDEELQKLLVIDESDIEQAGQTFQPLSVNELLAKEYISMVPVTRYEISNVLRNTTLAIAIDELDFREDPETTVRGEIYCLTDRDHMLLKDNRLRLLEILDHVLKLHNAKISVAGIINFHYATSLSLSEHIMGYKIVFEVKEQVTRKAEL